MSVEIWNPGYDKFTYFWTVRSCFSQWHPSAFVIDGVKYSHAEQWVEAEKARLFDDEETLQKILKAGFPIRFQMLGREVEGFDESVWESAAKDIVAQGNEAKFRQNGWMLETLLETEGTLLAYASPHDLVWGIGISEAKAKAGKPWRGTNWLGEILTQLRDRIIKE